MLACILSGSISVSFIKCYTNWQNVTHGTYRWLYWRLATSAYQCPLTRRLPCVGGLERGSSTPKHWFVVERTLMMTTSPRADMYLSEYDTLGCFLSTWIRTELGKPEESNWTAGVSNKLTNGTDQRITNVIIKCLPKKLGFLVLQCLWANAHHTHIVIGDRIRSKLLTRDPTRLDLEVFDLITWPSCWMSWKSQTLPGVASYVS